jgi:hypothetical protein
MHTSFTSGKSYIGKTSKSINERFKEHILDSVNSERHFHRAIRKYGFEDFTSKILEDNIPNDQIDNREIYWIEYYDTFNNGYNMTKGGDGGNTGGLKPETYLKLSEIGEDGLSEFNRRAIRMANTRKEKGSYITGSEKVKRKMLIVDEFGNNQYQRTIKRVAEIYHNKSDSEKLDIRNKQKLWWENTSEEFKIEHSKRMSASAKKQIENESLKTKEFRKNKASEACSNTVSCFDITDKSYKRIDKLLYSKNPLCIAARTNLISKIIIGDKVYMVGNIHFYNKIAELLSCKVDWLKQEILVPYKSRKKQLSHLDGIIIELVKIEDINDNDINLFYF